MKTKWTKRERDRVLDLYLTDVSIDRIARKLGKDRRTVLRLIKAYRFNRKDRAVKYRPQLRVFRRGAALSDNEQKLIRTHVKLGISTEVTARLMGRIPGEILAHAVVAHQRIRVKIEFNKFKTLAPSLDQLLALHYLYHCAKCPLISDTEYDIAKEEEIEYGCGKEVIETASKFTGVGDYPPHIRSLAYYLQFKHMEATGKWKPEKLPYDSMKYALSVRKQRG